MRLGLGAVSLPWRKAVNKNGAPKPEEEVAKLHAGIGVDGRNDHRLRRIRERSSRSWFD
jgi:3-mercaptopyruvate sulfurtransferase SseA